jgi:formate-dependent nitrite reductase membrane component NrfD
MSIGQPLAEAPWGWHLGIYLVLIGLATGLTLLVQWLRPANADTADTFEWRATWVTLATLAACVVILIMDLGRPERFFLMLTRFGRTESVMSWGAKLLALKSGLLLVQLYLLHRRRKERAGGAEVPEDAVTRWVARAVPGLLTLVSIALAVYPALLLARTWSSPLASTPGGSILFPATALAMGGAAAVLIALVLPGNAYGELRDRLERVLLFMLGTQGVLLLFAGVGGLGAGRETARLWTALLSGEYAGLFWGAVVVLGLVLPALLLLGVPRNKGALAFSAVATLASASAVRFLMFSLR